MSHWHYNCVHGLKNLCGPGFSAYCINQFAIHIRSHFPHLFYRGTCPYVGSTEPIPMFSQFPVRSIIPFIIVFIKPPTTGSRLNFTSSSSSSLTLMSCSIGLYSFRSSGSRSSQPSTSIWTFSSSSLSSQKPWHCVQRSRMIPLSLP